MARPTVTPMRVIQPDPPVRIGLADDLPR
jgi:hypothetical protein